MLAVGFRFIAGRYHATPWGRHVNEAEVAWPPDPWRIARALIATWYRKLDPECHPRQGLFRLLAQMAHQNAAYRLPAAAYSHTRHYMPAREKGIRAVRFDSSMRRIGLVPDPTNKKNLKPDTNLVFDAFARLAPDEPLVAIWDLDLADDETALLDDLLSATGYLGRAESWVEASRMADWNGQPDCRPLGEGNERMDAETGELRGETITLYAPRSPEDYADFRVSMLEGLAPRDLPKRERSRVEATLPEDWLDALSLETNALRAAGWSHPPAARRIDYLRPLDALTVSSPPRRQREPRPPMDQVTTFRYALYARPLPRIEDAVRVGEWIRLAAMGRARHLLGEDAIPSLLSGHGLPDGNRHTHAFYLPEDADDDGLVDHLMVHIPAGVSQDIEHTLRGLTFLKDKEGRRIQLVFEGAGTRTLMARVSDRPLLGSRHEWVSTTPYLHPWHLKLKKSLSTEARATEAWAQIQGQLRRECRERGLPEPVAIEWLDEITIGGHPRRPVHYHRFRSKRGLTQPDRIGRFLRLVFSEPVHGPVALGFGCHFGLGLFSPAEGK